MNVLEKFREDIRDRFGLTERSSWENDVKKALKIMCSENTWSEKELIERLDTDMGLFRMFCGYLTVEETYFLRHAEHFEFLSNFVEERLPWLHNGDRISIWSAGCSCGEEAYSAAIVIKEKIGYFDERKIRIFGTDINLAAISKARRAVYTAWSFRDVPPWFLAGYFDSIDGPGSALSEEIRQVVQFEHLSLKEHLAILLPESIDVIFFRNVAIYFDKESLASLFEQFRRVIKPNGALIVAPADPRPPSFLFMSPDNGETSVYHPMLPIDQGSLGPPSLTRETNNSGAKSTKGPKKSSISRSRRMRTLRNTVIPPQAPHSPSPQFFSGNPVDEEERSDVVELANRGEISRALEIATKIVNANPSSKASFFLRGQILLCGQNIEEAVSDFRRVVFMDSTDKIARFWYATALLRAAKHKQAEGQLNELEKQLLELPSKTTLEDGQTTADELLSAVRQIVEQGTE